MKNKIKGGLADNKTMHDLVHHHGEESWASIQFESLEQQLEKQLEKGIKVELEHTSDKELAKEIAFDHLWEDRKYYDKLETIEESVELKVADETPESITVIVLYNGRNAGIIMVAPSPTKEDTLEIVGIKFKKDYEELHIISQGVNTLWSLFSSVNSIIVAPKIEAVQFWNKLGFDRISPNYLISNRGH